ncbi:YihY/virulence factor BrkB family protein [Vreelandella utahensis]|uniref:YihY/virulence factor BrkB family protein n=1 Tax=Vreelandella halophila TaxID=86177 RepID=UPI001C4DFC61|nr:YihY/virulence factor BrkB family protein [Halomonas utahensis]
MIPEHLTARLKEWESWLLEKPDHEHGQAGAFARRQLRVGYAVGRDLMAGQLNLHAMSLVYTTLLSMVPLLALSFSVLKAMGVHNQLTPVLYQFFEPLGRQGTQIAEQVITFVDNIKVGVLGSVGLLLLVYTVIALVQKIERSFNMVWRAPMGRSLGQRFSNYLSVITIGPLLMVAGIGLSATVFGSDVVQQLSAIEPFGTVVAVISRSTPFLITVIAFTFVYAFVPNTRVRFQSALVGGVVAGVAWQAASLAFASFAVNASRYEAIYSSFAIGILLLIWLYINWIILLSGASISYYHQHEQAISSRREVRSSPQVEERLALALMERVAKAFDQGDEPPRQELLALDFGIPGDITQSVSDKLIRAGILHPGGDDGEELIPARSLDRIRLVDILSAVRADEDGLLRRLPDVDAPQMEELADTRLTRTLADWVR